MGNLYNINDFEDFKDFIAGKVSEPYTDLSVFNSVNDFFDTVIEEEPEKEKITKIDEYEFRIKDLFKNNMIKILLIIFLIIVLMVI